MTGAVTYHVRPCLAMVLLDEFSLVAVVDLQVGGQCALNRLRHCVCKLGIASGEEEVEDEARERVAKDGRPNCCFGKRTRQESKREARVL